MRQQTGHLFQSDNNSCDGHGDLATTDSSCSSCSSSSMASGGDCTPTSGVHSASASNGIAASSVANRHPVVPSRRQELHVEDVEEGEERGEEEEEERGEEEEEEIEERGEEEEERGEEEKERGEEEREEEERGEEERGGEEGGRTTMQEAGHEGYTFGRTAISKPYAYKTLSHDRTSKPTWKDRHARPDGGGDGTSTPEQQAANMRSHHPSTVIPSGATSKPSSSKSHLHPSFGHYSPSQPTSTANDDGNIQYLATHTKRHSESTRPSSLIPVTSPPRPAHLSAAKHRLPPPSSMAFSIPLSPERPKEGTAHWMPFVRKRNKGPPQSCVPSSAKGMDCHPSKKVAPPPAPHKNAHHSNSYTQVGTSDKEAHSINAETTRRETHSHIGEPSSLGTRRETHSHIGEPGSLGTRRETHSHKGEPGSLGTCNTCGAYLFPSSLGGDGGRDGPPTRPLGKPPSGSSCQLCAKVQKQTSLSSTGHLGSNPLPSTSHLGANPLPSTSHLGANPLPSTSHLGANPLPSTSHLGSNPLPSTSHLGANPLPSGLQYTLHGEHHRTKAPPRHSGRFSEPEAHTHGSAKLQPPRTSEPARHNSHLERQSSNLSLSSLSLSSSCSVASDILSRARERKDFWSSTVPPAAE